MPSWKKVVTSGSSAHLQAVVTDGNISGSLTSTGSFGHVMVDGSDFTTAVSSSAQAAGFGSGGGGGTQNVFSTISVAGQSDIVADGTTDTLTLAAGDNVSLGTVSGTDTITINATQPFTGGGISGSLGTNADFIRSLTAVGVTGSITTTSASLAADIATNATNHTNLTSKTIVSSSNQIASEVSGAFGNQRVGTNDDVQFDDGTFSGNLTVTGNITYNSGNVFSAGSQAVSSSMFLGSGSVDNNMDVGIHVQSGSVAHEGSSLFHNTVGAGDQRWSIAKTITTGSIAITPLEYAVTVKTSELDTIAGNSQASNYVPTDADKEYGKGEMYINGDGEVFIYS
jgi:hypothetical protein